ncbi:MAG: hypothetical protein KAR05_02170 [Candidatus Omnitrophica bacterium]|nr:hypothetical protein [Candidatus Omnitrophota bacterium]
MITRDFTKYFKQRLSEGGVKEIFCYYFNREFVRLKIDQMKDSRQKKIEKKCFLKGERVSWDNKRMRFITVAWGSYVDLFFSYVVPSLLQESNIPALYSEDYIIEWDLYTKKGDQSFSSEFYQEILEKLNKYVKLNIIPLEDTEDITYQALLQHVRKVVRERSLFVMTPSDTIFGNASLFNAVKLIAGKGICLAAAHPRVDTDKILESHELDVLKRGGEVENDQLVDIAFRYGHPALLEAFDEKDMNVTLSGLSVRPLDDRHYGVISNLPTPYLCLMDEDDLKFFENDKTYNNWDRKWLQRLVQQSRIKFVGSSEAFFCIELTPFKHPVFPKPNCQNNDWYKAFEHMRIQNHVCNNFYCIWTKPKQAQREEHRVC